MAYAYGRWNWFSPSLRLRMFVHMMTSSNGNIFRVTDHLCGEFTGHRWIPSQSPVTQSFGVFFDLRLNKRLREQSRRRWFETPSRSLWHHCNASTWLNDCWLQVKTIPVLLNECLTINDFSISVTFSVITRYRLKWLTESREISRIARELRCQTGDEIQDVRYSPRWSTTYGE